MKDDYSRHAWVHFLKNMSDSGDAFKKCLADAHADGVPSKVGIVRSDNGASSLMANLEKCVNSPT